jgi:hypothetical protein
MKLTNLFGRSRSPGNGRRPRCRPQLEPLEERLVMNNRFVVPQAQNDNVTKFTTLQAALTAPGLAAGDVIQIEPGSVPGSIGGADMPAVQNFTIQGDPSVRAEDLTAFDVTSGLDITQSQAGLTLRNVHFTLNTTGNIQILADATIADCSVQSSVVQGTGITLSDTTGVVITDNHMVAEPAANQNPLLDVEAVDGAHNLISGNTLQSLAPVPERLLRYESFGGPSTVHIADRVLHNTFISTGNSTEPLVQVITASSNFTGSIHGLDIEANTFIEQGGTAAGLDIVPGDVQATIVNNDFHLSGGQNTCLAIFAQTPHTTSQFLIAGNRFGDDALFGLALSMDGAGDAIQARVEGNDFHNCRNGFAVQNPNGGDSSGVDLGGGNQGSLGGNDFRGFTPPGPGGGVAIEDTVDANQPPLQAQRNLFSVADPHTVISDHSNFASSGTVVSDNNLTGNAAFVQSLFVQFLHRAGDTTNPQDAGGFVTLLNNGASLNIVADAVIHSQEALDLQVEDLYQRLLGRDAAASEQAAWAFKLQHGRTLETVTEQILESPEYRSRFADDKDFVQSLYRELLHRDGSDAEVASWLAALPAIRRAGVAQAFLTSLEFRADVIGEDYAQLLHRTPSDAEVNGWLATGLDALSMDLLFASSGEFQANG